MAGVVGHRQYLFDVLGDTVNVAARIRSEGMANTVNVSAETRKFVSHLCQSDSHGRVTIKGKGEMDIYQIKGRKNMGTGKNQTPTIPQHRSCLCVARRMVLG